MADREPERVAAAARRNDACVDVSVSAWLDLGAGFRASVETSMEAPERRDQELVGTLGRIRRSRAWFPAEDDVEIVVERPGGALDRFTNAPGNAYRGMVDAFAGLVRRGEPVRFGTHESLRLARTLDRIADAAR
jgi:predicted dehydrogenase